MNKNLIKIIFLLLLSVFSISCSDEGNSDDDYGNEEDGYALASAEGHSFQFFNSRSKWIFKVAVSQGKIAAVTSTGMPYGEPDFDYTKTGDNEAECWIAIKYQFPFGEYMIYNGYIGRAELLFTGPKKGTYKMYDALNNKQILSGAFSVDNNDWDPESPEEPDNPEGPDNPNIPDTPDVPDIPEVPDIPTIPSTAIQSKIVEVYEDLIIVDFDFDENYASSITQMGHCWSTQPHPTILNSSTNNVLNSDRVSGRAQCKLEEKPGTNYYIRAYAQVGTEFVYFNEMEVQSVGKDIKLSVSYSKSKNQIAVDYGISNNGYYTLYFYAPLTLAGSNVVNDNLGIVSKGQGTKYVPNYSCFYYYAYLKEVSTGIKYCSKIVYK